MPYRTWGLCAVSRDLTVGYGSVGRATRPGVVATSASGKASILSDARRSGLPCPKQVRGPLMGEVLR